MLEYCHTHSSYDVVDVFQLFSCHPALPIAQSFSEHVNLYNEALRSELALFIIP